MTQIGLCIADRALRLARISKQEVGKRVAGIVWIVRVVQANPTSNKIYEAIGYRRVVDMANLRVE